MRIILLLISIFIAGCATKSIQPTSSKRVVHIAANLPMTGDLGIYGQCVRDGSQMALDDLAKSDKNGPVLIVDWQDNGSTTSSAVSIAQKQLLDNPDIYVSGLHPQTMAIKHLIAEKGIPHFVWIFDLLINKTEKGHTNPNNCLRPCVNFKIEPPIFLDYAKTRKAKRVAIVYVYLDSTEDEYKNIVIPGLKKLGVKDLLVEPYDAGLKDFKSIAVKLQAFKPDLTIISGFQTNDIAFVRAIRPLGLIKDGNIVSSYDLIDASKVLKKDELEGIRFTAPTYMINTQQNAPASKTWIERFQKRTGRMPLYCDTYAYDAILIIHDAAKRLNLPAGPQQWLAALRTTKLSGISGMLSFDDDGSLQTPVELAVFRNGEIISGK